MQEQTDFLYAEPDRLFDTVRLIVDDESPGDYNMAIDESLLLSLGPDSRPVIRFYGFSPATLSVGRFQRTADVIDIDAANRDGVPLVRRPSAGQAVLHEHELTYCFVCASRHLEPFSKRAVYRFVVPLLMRGLEALGVPNPRSVTSVKGERTNPDCFATTSEYEIDGEDGRKLIGSAQMVTRDGVLQHGSIPLRTTDGSIHRYLKSIPDQASNHKTDVSTQARRPVGFDEAVKAFTNTLKSLLPVDEGVLTDTEYRLRDELLNTKYSQVTWNRKY